MSEFKICSRCNAAKRSATDFYLCQGKSRSECKSCTIKKNVKYQRKVKAWKNRFVDNDTHRSYMVEYYAKNREKFAAYREKFRKKYPDYHREYARKRKESAH